MEHDIIYKAVRHFPKINYHRGYGAKPRVHCPLVTLELRRREGKCTSIDLEEISPIVEASLTYNVRTAKVEGSVACGAGVADFLTQFYPHDGASQKIAELADSCHLNTLKAGTRPQMAALKAYELAWEKYAKKAYVEAQEAKGEYVRSDLRCFHVESDMHNHYGWACRILKEAGLYEDRGYKYGHGWLCEVLSEATIASLVELFPDPSINHLPAAAYLESGFLIDKPAWE